MNVAPLADTPAASAINLETHQKATVGCEPEKMLRRILMFISFIAAGGIVFGLWLRTQWIGQPDPRDWFNVFYVLFARNEPVGLLVLGLFSLAAAFVLFRKTNAPAAPAVDEAVSVRDGRLLALIAVGIFAIAAAGTQFVCHNYAVTADENMADFQAQIFLRGKIQTQVPERYWPAVRVIRPTSADYSPKTHSWNSPYLPVYSAMRALVQSVGLQSLLNPLLAALTVLALYGTARNIWPEKQPNALIAAILLASSSQFLLMAMTSYSMPAHLALNTIWLWLYSRPDRRAFYLSPVVGVLALGLHQPFFHALFAAPFLVRLLFQRRWRAVAIFAIIYFAGCVAWFYWWTHYKTQFTAGGMQMPFKLLNPRMTYIQAMNVCLVVGWCSLATPLLAALGGRRFFKLPHLLQDAMLSCLLTFIFYFFFYLDQAHGWGYRYFHGVISCLVLIAVAGWNWLSESVGERRAKVFLLGGVVASLLVQLPLRCFQAESFVRPFARAAAALHAIPADIVAVDPRDAWYSADLIRNDPFLEKRPLMVSLFALTPEAVAVLEHAGSVRFIDRDTLARLGMATERFDNSKPRPFAPRSAQ